MKTTAAITLIGASAIVLAATLAQAQEWRPPLRYGYTSGWAYDARNDRRDLPTNGYFPGNFAADPYAPSASGFFGSRRVAAPTGGRLQLSPTAARYRPSDQVEKRSSPSPLLRVIATMC